jgi:hypothetical protein
MTCHNAYPKTPKLYLGYAIRERTRPLHTLLLFLLISIVVAEAPNPTELLDGLEAKLIKLKEENSKILHKEGEIPLSTKESSPPAQLISSIQQASRSKSSSELDAVRAAEAVLTKENLRLRQRLHHWRGAAKNLAKQVKAVPTKDETTRQADSFLGSLALVSVFGKADSPVDGGTVALRLLVLFVAVNAVLFLFWQGSQTWISKGKDRFKKKEEILWQAPLQQPKASPSTFNFFDPMLRLAGYGAHELEISQIQVGNLPAGGDVFVAIQVGRSREVRTQVAERSMASVVQFKEPLRFSIPWFGPDSRRCLFRIGNADLPSEDTIAFVEIPSKELLQRLKVRRGHPQLCNFTLLSKVPTMNGTHPYISMKLQDVSSEGRKG